MNKSNNWIRVTDMEPPKKQLFLGCTHWGMSFGIRIGVCVCPNQSTVKNGILAVQMCCFSGNEIAHLPTYSADIVYWMPLPELPELHVKTDENGVKWGRIYE